jgi:hypothetical protein
MPIPTPSPMPSTPNRPASSQSPATALPTVVAGPSESPYAALLAAADARMAKREALARWDAAVRTFKVNSDAPTIAQQGDWYYYNLEPFLADIRAERQWLAVAGPSAATPFATALPDQWTREAR